MKIKRRDFIKGCAGATGMIAMTGGGSVALAGDPANSQMSDLADKILVPINGNSKPATKVIAALNEAVLDQLPFADTSDYADAAKNLVTPLPPDGAYIPPIMEGAPPVWDLSQYDFLKTKDGGWAPAEPEANPSLWRQAQVNLINGLFEVVPGIYQVRGQDITNLTIVETDSGIILIDPCQTRQTTAAALKLYQDQRDLPRARKWEFGLTSITWVSG